MGFYLDTGRENKAPKIAAVINDVMGRQSTERQNVLDVGCGGGTIAAFFSISNEVYGTDVEDRILANNRGRINFVPMDGPRLPFPDGWFDIVISNHVVEHINDQASHVKEIHRVLKPNGICYMATPNRYFPVEPHYRIPFIHYFPTPVFLGILKALQLYREDVFLLSHRGMIQLIGAAGFSSIEYTSAVLRDPGRYHLKSTLAHVIPKFLINPLAFLSPTIIFVLKRGS